jgi:hypothetical protein
MPNKIINIFVCSLAQTISYYVIILSFELCVWDDKVCYLNFGFDFDLRNYEIMISLLSVNLLLNLRLNK